MNKLTKFLRHPRSSVRKIRDHLRAKGHWSARRSNLGAEAPTAFLVGFHDWKTYILEFLADYNVVVLSRKAGMTEAALQSVLSAPKPHVFAWSYRIDPAVIDFCHQHGVPLTYVEDGFLRSVGLGADRTRPLSLVFDKQAMHFDRARSSDLETLLQTHDFAADTALMDKAEALLRLIVGGLSKYNFAAPRRVGDVLDPARRHVLVLGQVEDDLSIRFGAERIISGNEVVALAAQENPDAQILYRPHPEALAFAKPHYSKPAEVAHLATILGPDYAIGDCLDNADLVYTVTSLAGFEAALRGKPVVTLGAPFYSGWGFTQDRLPIGRRTRRLTPSEVLAGAYLLYPRYAGVDPSEPDRPGAALQAIEDLMSKTISAQAGGARRT